MPNFGKINSQKYNYSKISPVTITIIRALKRDNCTVRQQKGN